MNATRASVIVAEVPGYAELQREIHDALRAQHPEWIDDDGNSPMCDSYEARFAELLFRVAGYDGSLVKLTDGTSIPAATIHNQSGAFRTVCQKGSDPSASRAQPRRN